LATITDLKAFVQKAKSKIPYTAKIEIECESVEMAERAMDAGADLIMCDNMSLADIRRVVEIRNEKYPHILIEASGNIVKENLEAYAKTGVDALSSGSLIHRAVWLDFSMRIEE
jgi:nicotinate-nucleotide pyrophosphorylase (carboxylating)